MPNLANMEFFEGEDYTQPFIIKNAAGTAVVDITGWTITLTVKSQFDLSTTVLSKTASITSGPAGTCTVAFTRSDTSSVTPKTYAFDLSRTDSGADSCLVYGYLFLKDRAR